MENLKLEQFKKEIKGKRVAVIGIGVSNIPAIEYLSKLGAKITACDKKDKLGTECDRLKDLDISFNLGEGYLSNLSDFDYILRSPGVKPFTKEIEEAKSNGVKLLSEMELFVSLCPCKLIGITGSDGKTTTTTLTYMFLKEAGFNVHLGGNIGTPLFAKLEEIKEDDIVVLELSSFQLMSMDESPDIACITNISPNHLDYHRSFDEYIFAKSNIFAHKKNKVVVLNLDDSYADRYLEMAAGREVRKFSLVGKPENGVFVDGENIVSNVKGAEGIIAITPNVKLVGRHNLANICAAASCVIDLTGKEAIASVITSFAGVEHRLELVRTLHGVNWYNDAIATSPARTIAGLKSFKDKIILIAGGYDKKLSFDEIGKYIIDKVKVLILMGETADKIERAVLDEKEKQGLTEICKIVKLNNLEESINYANGTSGDGDNVVMSPASASFDMYKNFEEKGKHFKELVNKL